MATTISSTGSSVTTQGIGSGLDIAGIVDKLMTVEQAPLTRLQKQEAAYQTKLSAYSAAKSMLSTFQTSVSALVDPIAFSSFSSKIVDESVAGVTIDTTKSGSLSAGTHTLRVDRLAASQRTASAALASAATPIGSGTLTIDIGSWNAGYTNFTPNTTAGSRTITIDAGNDTLAGVRDAINQANAGVTASIVNDGTGNRLVLASTATGAANGFRITAADADGNAVDAAGLSQLAFDPASGTSASSHIADALDASFSLDGLAVTKADNHVTDVIDGLTIDLKAADATKTTAFSIARDTAAVKKNIAGFVSAYNGIVGNLASLTSYNAATKTAGVLNGDPSIRIVGQRLQAIVAAAVPTGGAVTTLADVGVKFTSTGTLEVDDARLTAALAKDPDAIGRLFAKTGVASDALVQYKDSTAKTQAGTHPITVNALASRGQAVASSAAGLVVTAGVNDTLALTVDNVPLSLTLAPGTYPSAAALATAIESKINGTPALASVGSRVGVSATAGVLTITSQRYGSSSSVVVDGGNGAGGLFGSSPTSTSGGDVSGTIDGTAFIGSGQVATGATSSRAEGMKLAVTGGATGSRGTVSFNRGLAAQIDDMLDDVLDSDGALASSTDGVNASIKDLQKREESWNTRLIAIKARYTAQYNAMDKLVASLNNTSTYLAQQIASWNKSKD